MESPSLSIKWHPVMRWNKQGMTYFWPRHCGTSQWSSCRSCCLPCTHHTCHRSSSTQWTHHSWTPTIHLVVIMLILNFITYLWDITQFNNNVIWHECVIQYSLTKLRYKWQQDWSMAGYVVSTQINARKF